MKKFIIFISTLITISTAFFVFADDEPSESGTMVDDLKFNDKVYTVDQADEEFFKRSDTSIEFLGDVSVGGTAKFEGDGGVYFNQSPTNIFLNQAEAETGGDYSLTTYVKKPHNITSSCRFHIRGTNANSTYVNTVRQYGNFAHARIFCTNLTGSLTNADITTDIWSGIQDQNDGEYVLARIADENLRPDNVMHNIAWVKLENQRSLCWTHAALRTDGTIRLHTRAMNYAVLDNIKCYDISVHTNDINSTKITDISVDFIFSIGGSDE